ncbi:hypothetical protein QCA50_008458 [Cerrena zonata]|uniref:Uncharacterized protein n=1 Tax=Cerrena zonata TaxID=2478898 RepID=A0AAW0G301_9APHY
MSRQQNNDPVNSSPVPEPAHASNKASGLLNESDAGHTHVGLHADDQDHNRDDLRRHVGDEEHVDDTGSPSMAPHAYASEDMQTKVSLAIDEPLQSREDILARYEHALTLERSSPKPCIVPGNALQLIDDDPDGHHHHPPSIIIINDNNHNPTSPPAPDSTTSDTSSGGHDHEEPGERRPIPRVRFRSRVRITSGLPRHRHSASNPDGHPISSTSSSASGSPSSSISAPLRWQADENTTWGPLGRRLSAYAHANRWQRRSPSTNTGRTPKQTSRSKIPRSSTDERAPLLSPNRKRVSYVDSGLDGGGVADDERGPRGILVRNHYVSLDDDDDEVSEEDRARRAAALRGEEDAMFGKWPWRIFNKQVSKLLHNLPFSSHFSFEVSNSGSIGLIGTSNSPDSDFE